MIDVISAVPVPGIGFDNPLPPNVPEHVAAIAVFGNPSAKLGLPLTVSPVWGGRSIDLCNPGDPICQTDGERCRRTPGLRRRADQPGRRLRRWAPVASRSPLTCERVNPFH